MSLLRTHTNSWIDSFIAWLPTNAVIQYDLNGNLLTDGLRCFAWDCAGRGRGIILEAGPTNSPAVDDPLVAKCDLNHNGKIDAEEHREYVRALSRQRQQEARTLAEQRPQLSPDERRFYHPPRPTPRFAPAIRHQPQRQARPSGADQHSERCRRVCAEGIPPLRRQRQRQARSGRIDSRAPGGAAGTRAPIRESEAGRAR